MRKSFIAICSVLLVLVVTFAVLVPACVRTYPTYPSDLEIKAFTGGFAPWTPLYMIHIYPDGNADYSRMEPGDQGRWTGTWTHISSFKFTVDEMKAIWDAIEENDFFSLAQNYSTPAADGSFAVMSITANGVTHTVRTENTKVEDFDSIVITINNATPGDLDLFYNEIHPQADPPSNSTLHGSTTVTIEDCKITVTVKIELYGPGANDTFADKVKKDIEELWNKGNPHVECVCDCPIKEPGCSVTFNATVRVRKETDPETAGYHQIRVVQDPKGRHVSVVYVPLPKPGEKGTGRWDDNEPPKTYAHEAGHLMGEDDQYTKNPDGSTTPKPNHENDIMGDIFKCTEAPLPGAIARIVSAGKVTCPCECCPRKPQG